MKKIVKEEDKNTSELWFNWLTRKLNSYEAFKDFASGQNPEDVAENFVAINSLGISDIFDKFDEEDNCLLYTSPSPRDNTLSRMPSSA